MAAAALLRLASASVRNAQSVLSGKGACGRPEMITGLHAGGSGITPRITGGLEAVQCSHRPSPMQPYSSENATFGQMPLRALYGEMLVVPAEVLASVVEHRHRLGCLPRYWGSPSNVHPDACEP